MQQRQREAFLAKFRNWAGKPLGQNFAPQGEGKKKKKKKKNKVAEVRAAAHEATTRPSRGGDFSAPNPKSEPLGYFFPGIER